MRNEPRKAVLGGKEVVQVAIAQIAPRYLDKEESVKRACAAIKEAAAHGAELVVFPEVWLAGYPYWTEGWDSNLQTWAGGRIRFRDAAITVPDESTEAIGQAARQGNVYVVMGCNELDESPSSNTIYNSLLFFGRDGVLMGRHRKLMPTFSERLFWGMGGAEELQVFDTEIGRLGGLICGEHLMTLVRAAMIAQGEEIHIAVFPGTFALHTGPQLEELDTQGNFWGHASVRNHAFEAGAFVLSACNYIGPEDIPDDFPYKNHMNISYAQGGSSIISPLGVPLIEPQYGAQIIYTQCHAWMIKATKAIIDTVGHYARPDILQLLVRGEQGWGKAGPALQQPADLPRFALRRAADIHEVDERLVELMLRKLLNEAVKRDEQALLT